MTRMTRSAGVGSGGESDREGDKITVTAAATTKAADSAAMPTTGRGPVFVASAGERDAGGVSSAGECSAGPPGDRFQPFDLRSLAAFHADNGAWADCLDVLDSAQEVHIS